MEAVFQCYHKFVNKAAFDIGVFVEVVLVVVNFNAARSVAVLFLFSDSLNPAPDDTCYECNDRSHDGKRKPHHAIGGKYGVYPCLGGGD